MENNVYTIPDVLLNWNKKEISTNEILELLNDKTVTQFINEIKPELLAYLKKELPIIETILPFLTKK